MEQNKEIIYYTHISSKHRWYNLNLKEIWKYRDLITLFTKRNFVLTYKQTILGPIWLFLHPFLTSVVFTIVFGGIAGISTDGVPEILFYLCSNALWGFFSECLNRNASTFVSNAEVFGKVYFPRMTVPIANMFSSLIRFGIQMIMIGVFWIYYYFKGDISPNWSLWILIPILLVQLGVLGVGVGILISSLTTKYRDLLIVVGFGVTLWMYVTPIVYPLSQAGDGFMQKLLLINPVTAPIEMFRYAVLGQGTIVPEFQILSWGLTILVAVTGLMLFNHVEKTFMDTV